MRLHAFKEIWHPNFIFIHRNMETWALNKLFSPPLLNPSGPLDGTAGVYVFCFFFSNKGERKKQKKNTSLLFSEFILIVSHLPCKPAAKSKAVWLCGDISRILIRFGTADRWPNPLFFAWWPEYRSTVSYAPLLTPHTLHLTTDPHRQDQWKKSNRPIKRESWKGWRDIGWSYIWQAEQWTI